MADNKIIIELQSKDSATGQITSSVREMEVSLKNLENSGSSAFSSINQGTESSIGSITRWVASIGAAAMAISGLKMAFTEGIKAADDFQIKTIGIAAALTNMAADGQGSFKDMFERNSSYAAGMYDTMRIEATKHFASVDDMMAAYNMLVQKGYAVRQDEVKYVGILADKIKLATDGQNYQIQVNQEIRALMEGQANANSSIAQELKSRLGPAWAEILEQHKEAGTLLKFLADQWPGIEAATERVTNTIKSQTTTLEGNLKYVGREGLSGAYQDIVGLLKEINDYLGKHTEIITNIQHSWENIRSIIKGAFDVNLIGAFAKKIEEITRNVDYFAVQLKSGWQMLKGDFSGSQETQRQFWFQRMEQAGPRPGGPGAAGPGATISSPYSRIGLLGYGSEGWGDIDSAQTKIQKATKDAVETGTKQGIQDAIQLYAGKMGIPAEIALGVARYESGFSQSALSPKGAIGVMQLMPGTARSLGVNPNNAEENIVGGLRYLREQYNRFGDWKMAAAAYNWGPENVARVGADWTRYPAETRKYLSNIFGKGADMASWETGVSDQERAQQQQADRWAKFQDKQRKADLKEQAKDAAEAAKISEKLYDDNLKSYLTMINNRKRLDTEAADWTTSAWKTVMDDEKLSFDERGKAAEEYKNLRIKQIDDEIAKLQEKYGGRIGGDVLESYRKAQTDQVDAQIKKATSPQILDWEAAWKRAAENVQDALSSTIYNLVTQTKTAGDMLKNIFQGVMKILSDMAAQAIMNMAKNGINSMFGASGGGSSGGGFLGGLFGSGAGLFGNLFGGGSVVSSTGADIAGAFTPISEILPFTPFASGGIVNRPTIGLVGEAGPEMILPLNRTGGLGNYQVSISHSPVYNYRPTKADIQRDARTYVEAMDKELRSYAKRTARNFVK